MTNTNPAIIQTPLDVSYYGATRIGNAVAHKVIARKDIFIGRYRFFVCYELGANGTEIVENQTDTILFYILENKCFPPDLADVFYEIDHTETINAVYNILQQKPNLEEYIPERVRWIKPTDISLNTVGELIEALKNFPLDMAICSKQVDCGDYCDAEEVSFSSITLTEGHLDGGDFFKDKNNPTALLID